MSITCDLSQKKWLNLIEAITYLGFGSKNTFREWRETGKIPYYKPGREIVYQRTDIDSFMKKYRNEAF